MRSKFAGRCKFLIMGGLALLLFGDVLIYIDFCLVCGKFQKKEHALDGLHIVCFLGSFLCVVLREVLHNMSDPAAFQRAAIAMMVIVFLEGLGITVLERGMNRISKPK